MRLGLRGKGRGGAGARGEQQVTDGPARIHASARRTFAALIAASSRNARSSLDRAASICARQTLSRHCSLIAAGERNAASSRARRASAPRAHRVRTRASRRERPTCNGWSASSGNCSGSGRRSGGGGGGGGSGCSRGGRAQQRQQRAASSERRRRRRRRRRLLWRKSVACSGHSASMTPRPARAGEPSTWKRPPRARSS